MSLVHQMREGHDNAPHFGTRMTGTGPYAALIAQRFTAAIRRLGLNRRTLALRTDLFERPALDGQLGLFDADAAAAAMARTNTPTRTEPHDEME